MSAIAPPAPRSVEWRAPRDRGSPLASDARSLTIRVAVFAALGTFCASHWATLVTDPPRLRALAVVLVAAAGAAALALTARAARRRTWAGRVVRPAVAVVTGAATLVAAGLPVRLLVPSGWTELADGLALGFAGLRTVQFPYAGGDDWVGLTILLAVPVILTIAAALTFWPARRAGGALRGTGLVLLLALYAVAAAEHEMSGALARGSLLFVLIAAWLFLPRVSRADAVLAGVAVLGAALVSVPPAARLDRAEPWVNYSSWNWFGEVDGVTYDWNHSYGPIQWPRDGDVLLRVQSKRSHYWRAATLGHFDGIRWVATPGVTGGTAGVELPVPPEPRWAEKVRVSVGALTSSQLISPGAVSSAVGTGPLLRSGDGTARLTAGPLEEGDAYTVNAYAPDPSAQEMRAAPAVIPAVIRRYTAIDLPRRDESSGLADGSSGIQPEGWTIALAQPGGAGGGTPGAEREVLASPYARVYELARRLTASAPTTYDAVKRIEAHLQQNYDYGERPPERAYPLAAFLFEDRIGYCQQFSGAMALMLRMNGIAARVASGFAPGVPNDDTEEFTVRDRDAHSWVEVYFQGIGWVPFDPTPSAAPAESQSGGAVGPSAARGDPGERLSDRFGAEVDPPDASRADSDARRDAGEEGDRGRPAGPARGGGSLPAGVGWLAAALAVIALGGLALRHRRRPRADADAALDELRSALDRFGHPLPRCHAHGPRASSPGRCRSCRRALRAAVARASFRAPRPSAAGCTGSAGASPCVDRRRRSGRASAWLPGSATPPSRTRRRRFSGV